MVPAPAGLFCVVTEVLTPPPAVEVFVAESAEKTWPAVVEGWLPVSGGAATVDEPKGAGVGGAPSTPVAAIFDAATARFACAAISPEVAIASMLDISPSPSCGWRLRRNCRA